MDSRLRGNDDKTSQWLILQEAQLAVTNRKHLMPCFFLTSLSSMLAILFFPENLQQIIYFYLIFHKNKYIFTLFVFFNCFLTLILLF